VATAAEPTPSPVAVATAALKEIPTGVSAARGLTSYAGLIVLGVGLLLALALVWRAAGGKRRAS